MEAHIPLTLTIPLHANPIPTTSIFNSLPERCSGPRSPLKQRSKTRQVTSTGEFNTLRCNSQTMTGVVGWDQSEGCSTLSPRILQRDWTPVSHSSDPLDFLYGLPAFVWLTSLFSHHASWDHLLNWLVLIFISLRSVVGKPNIRQKFDTSVNKILGELGRMPKVIFPKFSHFVTAACRIPHLDFIWDNSEPH